MAELRGGKELDRLLGQIEPRLLRRLGPNALRAGGRVIVKNAKSRVPAPTGKLRDGIAVRTVRNVQFVAGKGLRTAGMSRVEVGVYGPRASFAHLVEFGTVRSRAKPFMTPALEEGRGPAFKAIRETLARDLAREAQKLVRGGRKR